MSIPLPTQAAAVLDAAVGRLPRRSVANLDDRQRRLLTIATAELRTATIRAMLTFGRQQRDQAARLVRGELTIDLFARRAAWSGRELVLCPREWTLLYHLACCDDRVVSTGELLDAVCRFTAGRSTRIRVQVYRLRATLRAAGAPALIRTVRGRGYRFEVQP